MDSEIIANAVAQTGRDPAAQCRAIVVAPQPGPIRMRHDGVEIGGREDGQEAGAGSPDDDREARADRARHAEGARGLHAGEGDLVVPLANGELNRKPGGLDQPLHGRAQQGDDVVNALERAGDGQKAERER